MANRPAIEFLARFVGDGSSTSVALSLLTNPVLIKSSGNTMPVLVTDLPGTITDAVSVTVDGGLTISTSSYSVMTKTLTVNFTGATVLDTEYAVSGIFVF